MNKFGWVAATLIVAVMLFAVGACGVADRADEPVPVDLSIEPADAGVEPEPSAPTPEEPADDTDTTTVDCTVECPAGTAPVGVVCSADGAQFSCEPIPPEEPPPVVVPPAGPTVAVWQDAGGVCIALSGDYMNLGAWQAENGRPLPSDADLAGCLLAPASAETGWDGVLTPGSAFVPMVAPSLCWTEPAAIAGNCDNPADRSSERRVFTFRAVCGSAIYWPDLGAWTVDGSVVVSWSAGDLDNDGIEDWRGGICRTASD